MKQALMTLIRIFNWNLKPRKSRILTGFRDSEINESQREIPFQYSIPLLIFVLLASTFMSISACAGSGMVATAEDTDSRLFFSLPGADPEGARRLPNPQGPYQVSTSTLFWVDENRPDTLTPNPSDLRQILVQVWYPAQRTKDVRPVAYFPELEALMDGLRARGEKIFRTIADDLAVYRSVQTDVVANEPLLPTDQPYPLVIFSPGGNMSRHWYSALARELASQGYVVAVLSHEHSGLDFYPLGGAIPDAVFWHPDDSVSASEKARRDGELTTLLAGDAEFVLDRFTSPGGPGGIQGYEGNVSQDEIAIVGHSRGGSTVGRVCSEDDRIKACVILDNIGPEPEINKGLSVPQMTIRSEWSEARVQMLHEFLQMNRVAAWDICIDDASHFSFSDLPLVNMEKYPTQIDSELAHEILMSYLLSFLDYWLKGRPDSLLDLKEGPFPGVHVERLR